MAEHPTSGGPRGRRRPGASAAGGSQGGGPRRQDAGAGQGGRPGRRERPRRGDVSARPDRRDGPGLGDRRVRTDGVASATSARSRGERRPGRPDQDVTPRPQDPPLPADVTGDELDAGVRRDLRSLSKEGAENVARHLVMVARLLDVDPVSAWEHAQAARRRAGRLGVVREAAGLAAYRAGHYDEALRELRTVRRLTGDQSLLPVMADCERGLGRPERALELAASPEVAALDEEGQVEMRLVAAGARMDMGNPAAAVVLLQPLAQRAQARAVPWRARVWSVLADALEAAGRPAEARDWLERAADADDAGETGAAERLGRVVPEPGETIVDLLED